MSRINRLKLRLDEAARKKRKVFCAFLTLGFPDLAATAALIKGFETEGVDVLELGFPFSDPLADGPTIQFSSEWALKRHVKMADAFNLVKKLRRDGVKMPIVFFTYLNPVLQYGFKRFAEDACLAGFDGVIIPDLPPEEEKALNLACREKDLAQIFLVAPTTEPRRARKIAQASRGFIYYVSLRGVTGARKSLPSDIKRCISQLRKVTEKPILIGFGVSSVPQARELSKLSQGVIVGSALVEEIRRAKGKTAPVLRFVRHMVRAVHQA